MLLPFALSLLLLQKVCRQQAVKDSDTFGSGGPSLYGQSLLVVVSSPGEMGIPRLTQLL